MPFLTVTNMIAKPQDPLPSKKTYCLDADGTTIKVIDVKKEFERSYLILFFFTLGNQSDSEVLKFSASSMSCDAKSWELLVIVHLQSRDGWRKARKKAVLVKFWDMMLSLTKIFLFQWSLELQEHADYQQKQLS